MSHTIAIQQPRHYGQNLARVRYLLLGAFLGLVIGALGFAAVASSVDVVRAAWLERSAAAEQIVSYPPRELPREWRWEPKAVEFEHMYRQQAAPRIDWIRGGSHR